MLMWLQQLYVYGYSEQSQEQNIILWPNNHEVAVFPTSFL